MAVGSGRQAGGSILWHVPDASTRFELPEQLVGERSCDAFQIQPVADHRRNVFFGYGRCRRQGCLENCRQPVYAPRARSRSLALVEAFEIRIRRIGGAHGQQRLFFQRAGSSFVKSFVWR